MSENSIPLVQLWSGRVLHGLVTALLLADAAMQFFAPGATSQGMQQVGMPASIIPLLGTIMLVCALLYAIPTTTVLGAIVTTGFLGGAICTNVRVGPIVTPPVIICLMLGLMAWGGLYLKDDRVRRLIPLSNRHD